MTDIKPFTIHTELCIVCQEEGKQIVAEGNGFHHSGNYGIASIVYTKYDKPEKFCEECFDEVESLAK